jgi:LPS export ABC transporter protein LptC
MSREQARFLVALTASVLLVVVGYYLISTLRAQRLKDQNIADLRKDVFPDAAQRMQRFRRAKIVDGQKVWEIAANQARYLEEDHLIILEKPDVTLYVKDESPVVLRCQEGRVHLNDQQDISTMELTGDVEVQVNDFIITTPTAVYDQARDLISSSASLHIVGRGLEVEGREYTVKVSEKRLNLHADVRTTMTHEKGEG